MALLSFGTLKVLLHCLLAYIISHEKWAVILSFVLQCTCPLSLISRFSLYLLVSGRFCKLWLDMFYYFWRILSYYFSNIYGAPSVLLLSLVWEPRLPPMVCHKWARLSVLVLWRPLFPSISDCLLCTSAVIYSRKVMIL